MPTRKKELILDGISFDPAEPTIIAVERLYTWVIWQFPRTRLGGYSGAVHPPETGHGWYPAIINADAGQVLIFGNVKEQFPSPEAAAKFLDKLTDRN